MIVYFTCQDCHRQFPVEQGSRRKYCDSCLAKRITSGAKKGGTPSHKVKIKRRTR